VNRREPTGGSACPNAANQVVRVPRDMRDWVNFASTGNPGWASYDPNTRSTRVYTAEPTTQFWNSMISRRRRSGSMRLGRPSVNNATALSVGVGRPADHA
jgi:hypothetical protein